LLLLFRYPAYKFSKERIENGKESYSSQQEQQGPQGQEGPQGPQGQA